MEISILPDQPGRSVTLRAPVDLPSAPGATGRTQGDAYQIYGRTDEQQQPTMPTQPSRETPQQRSEPGIIVTKPNGHRFVVSGEFLL